MKRSAPSKTDNRRAMVAQEAARIIQEHGLTDWRAAKEKAATRLGLANLRSLPSNREVADALAGHQRLFHGEEQEFLVASLRQTALLAMNMLEPFTPKLVGNVLNGTATENSPITLHVFTDSPELVGHSLESMGVRHHLGHKRHKMQHKRVEEFSAYCFFHGNTEVKATVFPERRKAHAPLCPVDGRPMRRAGPAEVEALLFCA